VAEACGAPLSRKKAMLAAYLIDAFTDRMFAARAEPAADILQYRRERAAASPDLERVFDLVAGRAELVIDAVEVPLAEYGKLSVADFMVSLYNHHTVQRVRIVTVDGQRHDVHAMLNGAVYALRKLAMR
jgi:hypothetical protein